MSAFPARYAGRCSSCGELFGPGEAVAYAEDDSLVGQDCCGGSGEATASEPAVDNLARVMPRGKSVRDRCGTCFQIPSTTGVCGCDS